MVPHGAYDLRSSKPYAEVPVTQLDNQLKNTGIPFRADHHGTKIRRARGYLFQEGASAALRMAPVVYVSEVYLYDRHPAGSAPYFSSLLPLDRRYMADTRRKLFPYRSLCVCRGGMLHGRAFLALYGIPNTIPRDQFHLEDYCRRSSTNCCRIWGGRG